MSIPLTEYMHCAQHGGFKYSEEFIEEYEKRYGKPMCYKPTDPDAIALFKERGQYGTCHSHCGDRLICSIALAKVPIIYLDFVKLHEYDGLESLSIDHNEYIVDKLKRTDPGDSEAVAALIQEASAGLVHPGENMWQGKRENWYDSPWSSVITKESNDTQIETDDRVYFYAAPRTKDHTQTDSQDITDVLKRLARTIHNTEHPDKQVCLAIGGLDIPKATAMLVECAIDFDTRFELLRGLPLYYVDLDNTSRYVSSKNAFTSTDTDYDSSIF